MVDIFTRDTLGRADYGWLKPRYHFSFAQYYNLQKRGYGSLRVLNDDTVLPHKGFDTHPHKDMEIITYVIDGELTHRDSMNNASTLARGEVQYMSAGTGVFHSEINDGDEPLRLLQIWIIPDKKDHQPNYGEMKFTRDDRLNKPFPIVGQKGSGYPIEIHQEANITIGEYDKDETIRLSMDGFDYLYFILIEGTASFQDTTLEYGDAFVTTDDVTIDLHQGSHFLFIRTNNLK